MEVQSSSEVEAIDVEATYLHLETFNKGVMLRLSEPLQLTEGTGAGNLFVCSNLYGFVIVANNQGFCLFLLETIRNAFATAQPSSIPTITPVLKVTIPIRVAFIKLAMSEKLLVVGMSDGSVGVWDLQRLAAGNTTPLNGFPTSATIIDILPCPALDSPILVVLTTESLSVFSLSTFQPLITFPSYLNITSACWSVKGKQIIVGMKGGGLAQFTPEGEKKAEIIPPLSVQGAGYDVRSIHWLENHVFLVTYARPILPGTQPLHDDEVYLITRDASGGVKEYVKFGDPAPAFGMMERPGRRWIASLKTWTPLKHLLFMANAPSINIGLIGQLEDSNWVAVSLPDTSRPSLSPSEVTDSDTCPVGLELDFAKVDGKIEPRLLVYTSDGVLAAWKINNVIGGEYGAVVGTPVASISPFSSQTPSAFSSQTPSAFSSQTPSAISSQTPSAFASPASTANAFGSSGFGVPPVFGSTPAFGASTFGSSGFSAKPVTGGFSSFGTPSVLPTPVSVDSAFGLTASSGGFSNFKNVTSGPVASAFGAFGSTQSSGFGGAATTTDAVKSNWGSGSSFAPSPAFGTVSAKPSAFGQATTPAVPLAFPSATTNTPFGQSAPAASFPAFASPVTGTSPFTASSRTSVFGASSTPPAFGAKPVTFGTASTTSAFSSSGPRVTGMEMGRRGQVEDEDEEEMEPIEEVRGDDPPDLEPTRTGLAFGEGVIERVAPVEVPLPLAASSLGFGGLGLSASSTIIAPVTGIFGPQPVVVVAQVKTTSAGFGFGFGASAFPTAPAISSFGNSSSSAFGVATTSSAFGTATTSAFGTSTTSAFGSSPFGQPSVSAFEKPIASISAFDSTPKVQELPAIEAVASKGSISVTEIISPAPSPPISSTPPIFSTPPRSVTPPNLASVGVSTTPAGVPPATSSTKSFFGFASSPPMNTVGLARANSISQVVESDSQKRFGDETVEGEEEDIYSDEAEEEDEEEGEEDEEEEYSEEGEGEEYDEDALYDEAERTMPLRDHSQEVEESQVEEEEELTEEELTEEEEEEVATAVKPDRLDRVENPLLARLETQSKVDSPTISPPVIAEKQIAIPAISPLPTPNSFPFLPTTTSPFGLPSKIPSPFSLTPTPPPIIAPAVDPSLFTLPKPTLGGVIPNKPIFGLNNLATPRSSSPLSFGSTTPSFPPPPPTSIPSAFSLKPAVITETIPKPSFIPGSFGNILPASAIPLPLSAPQTPSLISPVSPITLPTFPSVTFKPTPPSSIPPTPDRNGFPLGSTIAPKLGDNISNGKSVKVEETGMTGEFLKTYQILESEFAVLRKNTIICQSFVKEISLPCQTTKQANDFDDSHWSMGDLERLKALTIEVSPKISSLVSIAIGQKRQVAELQSLMLKAETKREEAARFIRAKSDPAVARMVRVRQLGPEQSETQKKLRASVQAATSQLEQLEDHLLLVKDKIVEDRLGQSSFKTPPLDDVNRTIHNISTLVIRKTNEIDELSLRLNMARVSAASNSTPKNSTPQKSSRHRSPSVDTLLGTSTLGSSPGIKAPPILNPDVIATADASLLAERNVGILKRALLAVRTKPLLNKSACTKNGKGGKNQFTDLQTAFSAGPITGNNLPLPRRQDVQSIPFPEAFAASSSTLPPSWSFSNPSTPIQKSNIVGLKAPSFISFNTPTSPAVNHDSPSSISKRGAPSKTSRSSTHASATSLKTTNAYNKSFIPPPNPSFDWGPIPTPSISNTRDFISFDGLQTPEVVKIEPITLKEDDVIDSSEEEEEGEEGDDSDNELEAEDGWDENEFDGEGVISLDDIPEE